METQPQPQRVNDGHGDDSHALRGEPRSNLFVMATLYSQQGSVPVRLRNLSTQGALLEGAELPPAGAKVRLSRGTLHVSGEIVWNGDGRAGAQFESRVTVADWLPQGLRAARQQAIDQIICQARSGAVPTATTAMPAAPRSLEQQVAFVRQSIDAAAEALAADPFVAQCCAGTIQQLDQAGQLLGSLLAGLGGGGGAAG